MAGPTRDRSCLYYWPWIPLMGLCILGAGVGIMVYHGSKAYSNTQDGLSVLGVSADNVDLPRPALIATAAVSLFLVVMIAGLSLARSFIEAAHDATGQTGSGSAVWMVFNVLVAIPWWCVVWWSVLLLMGTTIWAGLLYMVKTAINEILNASNSLVAVIPAGNLPCPPNCLNLSYFEFLQFTQANSCICAPDTLRAASNKFSDALALSPALLVGVWLLFLGALVLLVNFACQFSHTKRERDYLRRLTDKQFVAA